ncbi:Hypothetical_protein [Hexamita inflata]|uniref:Hypothetical_protein n=1 Tax=Hexamita inflata TaxID=28002 RepID=A0ABP1HC55_9EUKA
MPRKIYSNNCYQPFSKIHSKQIKQKSLELLNCEIFDISECSNESIIGQQIQPIFLEKTQVMAKQSIADSSSCDILWDMYSRKDVKLKTIKKNKTCNLISDIAISTFENSDSCFDPMQLLSELGI